VPLQTQCPHLNYIPFLFTLPNSPVHVAVLLLQQRRVLRVGQVALIVGVVIVTVLCVVTTLKRIHNITTLVSANNAMRDAPKQRPRGEAKHTNQETPR
jgi:hypothetical protein